MINKKIVLLFYVIVACFLTAKAQPLTQGLGSEYQLRLAKVDSNTLQWRNKLYPNYFQYIFNIK